MRVVVVSHHPALALALGAQIPGCDAVEAVDLADAARLSQPGDVTLVDPRDPHDAEAWASELRRLGVAGGLVVVSDRDEPAHGLEDVVWISRPFALEELATAFEALSRPHDELAAESIDAEPEVAAQGTGEPGVVPPSLVELDAATGAPERADPDEGHGAPDVVGEPPDGNPTTIEDVGTDVQPAAPPTPPAADAPPAVPARGADAPAPSSTSPAASITSSLASATARAGALLRALRRRRPAEPGTFPVIGSERSLRRRVRDGLEGARTLEELLATMPALADPQSSAAAVIEELVAEVPCAAAAVALTGVSGGLEIVSGHALTPGESITQVPAGHPLVRRVRDEGGVLLLSPTDEARGWLAGIPVSRYPTLIAATVVVGDALEALVLVGQDGDPDPAHVRVVGEVVDESADLLALAALLRRLPRPAVDEHAFLHSWMRG